jgi:hypothetical protein
MSPPSGADEVSSCYSSSDSSSDGDRRRHQEEEEEDNYAASVNDRHRCLEEEEEDDYADDAGSQVTFDTSSIAGTDFLTPGGLNLFTVALSAKSEKLFAKDLPKIIKASGISKKNYRATIDALNVGIRQLRKTAIAENSTARRRDRGPSHSRSHQNDPLLNHGITTDHTCYDPPLPNTDVVDAQFQQWEAYTVACKQCIRYRPGRQSRKC